MLAFDLETVLIAPGLQAPPPVCISWCCTGEGPEVAPAHEAVKNLRLTTGMLEGHNVAYDMLCLLAWHPELTEWIFSAYRDLRVVDTGIRERIAEITGLTPRKRLSLEVLASCHGLVSADKTDGIRLSYGPLLGRPIEEYSDEQKNYARADAAVTLAVGDRQRERWPQISEREVAILTRKAFWLALTKSWGMRTHPDRVTDVERLAKDEVSRLCALAVEDGFVIRKTDTLIAREAVEADAEGKPHKNHYKKSMKVIRRQVHAAYHSQPPLTDTGIQVQNAPCEKKCCAEIMDPGPALEWCPNFFDRYTATDRVTLEESGDPILKRFSEYGQWTAVANKDVPMLLSGVHAPIHTRYSFANTTRTISSGPNLQNVGNINGIRECFIPPEGHAIISADYHALEVCTLAQVLIRVLGDHTLADELNSGIDPHSKVGAEILGISYLEFIAALADGDTEVKQARQLAKVPNFGKPGGMADLTLIGYARGLKPKVVISEEQALMLGAAWRQARPDAMRYLNEYVRSLREGDLYDAPIPGTDIVRRQIPYCAAANTAFQGLGAVVTNAAGWELAQEMYLPTGRLQDVRSNGFIHDEFLFECPISRVAEVAPIIEEIMVSAGQVHTPDVQLRVEAVASDRWSKYAEPVRDEQGKLGAWTPKV